ncbi:hypothetical protein ACG92T_15875 [Acinetobacter ursingii]|uniref:hypothetical protein n=1 Tax=Acinetobacter ursingii TaxID=108980 RepID=UPI003AF64659
MIRTYDKNTGDQSVRVEITYKPSLSTEEMLVILSVLHTAPFFDFSNSAELLREKLISLYPEFAEV